MIHIPACGTPQRCRSWNVGRMQLGPIFINDVFGAPVPKATTISTTCPVPSDFKDAWCPGLSDHHSHSGKSEGFDADGHFLTGRLQTYPPLLCEVIAGMMVKSLQLMKLRGTGAFRLHASQWHTCSVISCGPQSLEVI